MAGAEGSTHFFLYLPSQESAQQVTQLLERDSLSAQVEQSESEGTHRLLIRVDAQLESNHRDVIERKLTELAANHGGWYDGLERSPALCDVGADPSSVRGNL